MPEAKTRQPRGDDPRFQRSLKALHDALVARVEEAPVRDISITDFVKASG